ncbi:hypothetical protein [Algoriphagus halophytocola]|uniref:DUF2188 domain-containing protein n=1 Tax=Algoriphagus halophytocola TaxID=2991499 RepID=A0ABY6MHP0_9BACT|nr:hypothetical protein [Algoriphagus sp. TR-M5]UZD23300.1 hypothetical protein OM944_02170 [Algoriphagus sp. TR-M5]
MKESKNINSLLKKFKESTKFHSDRIHIVEVEDGWSAKREGEKNEIFTVPTKNIAMDEVMKLPQVKGMVVHPKNGKIEHMEFEK